DTGVYAFVGSRDGDIFHLLLDGRGLTCLGRVQGGPSGCSTRLAQIETRDGDDVPIALFKNSSLAVLCEYSTKVATENSSASEGGEKKPEEVGFSVHPVPLGLAPLLVGEIGPNGRVAVVATTALPDGRPHIVIGNIDDDIMPCATFNYTMPYYCRTLEVVDKNTAFSICRLPSTGRWAVTQISIKPESIGPAGTCYEPLEALGVKNSARASAEDGIDIDHDDGKTTGGRLLLLDSGSLKIMCNMSIPFTPVDNICCVTENLIAFSSHQRIFLLSPRKETSRSGDVRINFVTVCKMDREWGHAFTRLSPIPGESWSLFPMNKPYRKDLAEPEALFLGSSTHDGLLVLALFEDCLRPIYVQSSARCLTAVRCLPGGNGILFTDRDGYVGVLGNSFLPSNEQVDTLLCEMVSTNVGEVLTDAVVVGNAGGVGFELLLPSMSGSLRRLCLRRKFVSTKAIDGLRKVSLGGKMIVMNWVIGVQFQQMSFTLYSAFTALLQPTIAPNWIDTVHGPVYPGKFFREIYAEFKASLKDFDWDVYANGRGHLVEPGKFKCFGKWRDAVVYGARKQEIKDPIDDTPALEEDGDPRVGASTVAPSISACGEHGAWSSVEQLCVCHDGWKTVGSDPCGALISSILGGDGGMPGNAFAFAPGLSPAAEMLNVLGVPADIGPCLVDWLVRESLDRLEIIAKMSESDWVTFIEDNLERQRVDGVEEGVPSLNADRAQAARLYGSTMSDEARRLQKEGNEQARSSAPDRDAMSMVQAARERLGFISPDLLPDVRVPTNMIKSPAAYVEFSNFDESHAGATARQRIRPTVTGAVVVTLEEEINDPEKGTSPPRFSMGRWMMQFARYSTALMVIDPDCAGNCAVFSRYQLEVEYLADETSCKDALEAVAKYRRSISKKVLSGIPLWQCFTEDHFRNSFDRALSEAAGREAYREVTRTSKGKGSGKGSSKGYGKGFGKGSGKGPGKGRKDSHCSPWSEDESWGWGQWGSKENNSSKRGQGGQSQSSGPPPKKPKTESH
ncbi:hypothetical protein FOZ61_010225, partial [Perkinsus olseni]